MSTTSPPIRVRGLAMLTEPELEASVRAVLSALAARRAVAAPHLHPARLHDAAALTIASWWQDAEGRPGAVLSELVSGRPVPRDALVADVDAVITEHSTTPGGRPLIGFDDRDDSDLQQLRLLRAWAEAHP